MRAEQGRRPGRKAVRDRARVDQAIRRNRDPAAEDDDQGGRNESDSWRELPTPVAGQVCRGRSLELVAEPGEPARPARRSRRSARPQPEGRGRAPGGIRAPEAHTARTAHGRTRGQFGPRPEARRRWSSPRRWREARAALQAEDQWPQPQLPPQQPPPPVGPPKLGCPAVPCVAKTENCLRTFAEAQSGQSGSSPFRTSSSKCDSHSMQTYS